MYHSFGFYWLYFYTLIVTSDNLHIPKHFLFKSVHDDSYIGWQESDDPKEW